MPQSSRPESGGASTLKLSKTTEWGVMRPHLSFQLHLPCFCPHNHQASALHFSKLALASPHTLSTSVPFPWHSRPARYRCVSWAQHKGIAFTRQTYKFWQMAVKCLEEEASFYLLYKGAMWGSKFPAVCSAWNVIFPLLYQVSSCPIPQGPLKYTLLHDNTFPSLPVWIKV